MRILISGTTLALAYARHHLQDAGMTVTDAFDWDIQHLLLDVPSFRPGSMDPDTILSSLPRDITVWGGNLDHPVLKGHHCIDLLKDEEYLSENAAITADCTLELIKSKKQDPWKTCNILIIGWGRIGKSLASKLNELGCSATVAARKETDRFKLTEGGFRAMDTKFTGTDICHFEIIINTVPSLVLREDDLNGCDACLKIDLASKKGIAGEGVIWARGLPGKYAPERSGRLIAESFLRILKEEMP